MKERREKNKKNQNNRYSTQNTSVIRAGCNLYVTGATTMITVSSFFF
jgi:hypothetical protein